MKDLKENCFGVLGIVLVFFVFFYVPLASDANYHLGSHPEKEERAVTGWVVSSVPYDLHSSIYQITLQDAPIEPPRKIKVFIRGGTDIPTHPQETYLIEKDGGQIPIGKKVMLHMRCNSWPLPLTLNETTCNIDR